MHKKICTGRWQQDTNISNSGLLQYGLQSRFCLGENFHLKNLKTMEGGVYKKRK